MKHIEYTRDGSKINLSFLGRIDSGNVPEIESMISEILDQGIPESIVIDLDKLDYISSAGLRVILKLKKKVADIVLINASPEVYDIFEMTGFSQMMDIRKAYRVISTKGCEKIGSGANGDVYRIDRDTIVKVYKDSDALPMIHRERELARIAFIKGVPTAIPYDVVQIEEGGYGSVFELLNAISYIDLLTGGQKTVDEVAAMSMDLLKIIQSTTVDPGTMPSMKERSLEWAYNCKDHLPEDIWKKLHKMIEDIPEDNHMLHGDFHLKNIMLQNGESLLIDMETLCHGNPVYEFANMYFTYIAFDELNPANTLVFLGIPSETTTALWEKSLRLYLEGADEDTIQAARIKSQILGYTHLINHFYEKGELETERGKKITENCRRHLIELVPRTETLAF